MNRLKLNYSIPLIEDRNKFLEEYLEEETFKKSPLTDKELETCANYVLWGKDENGKNFVDKKEIEIETRNKTWAKRRDEESLDGLLETPTFNESNIAPINSVPQKTTRRVFSREDARNEAPPFLLSLFEDLWRQIDTIDLIINFYDLAHGKRTKEIRPELLRRFSIEEQSHLSKKSQTLNQYKYLKMRHLLVELRNQQYTWRDSYQNTIYRHTNQVPLIDPKLNPTFEEEIEVFPLGILQDDPISKSIFDENLAPENLSEELLKEISGFLLKKKTPKNPRNLLNIDFRNIEHVYEIFLSLYDLEDSARVSISLCETESTTKSLLETLDFYVRAADLTEVQREILNLKVRKVRNQDIASIINEKYKKSYTANYISTIFRQKIIRQINEAAEYHLEIMENIFFPENFKKCTGCGKTLLRDPHFFVRKSRAKDGLSNNCKVCDREKRKLRRENH